MLRRLLFLHLLLIIPCLMKAQEGKVETLPALPQDKTVAIQYYSSDRISDEMEQIQQTFRSWRRHAPSRQAFYNMIHQLEELIEKNPRDRGCAYMRMGQMYRTIDDPGLRSYQKAVECYTKAIPNLTHPDDINLLGTNLLLLGRCYLQEGEMQNIFQAVKYFSEAFVTNQNMGIEFAQMFLFGWGVPQDLYLAACIYDLQEHSDNLTDLNQLNYIRYWINHPERMSADGHQAWEDYVYTGDVKAQRGKLLKSATAAARGGVCEAMRELGLGWADGNFGGTTKQQHTEAFRWLRKGADLNYESCLDALALFCQRNVIDTAKGDIYTTDQQGNHRQSDIETVNRQSLAMMERAANMGDIYAQRTIGEWYINDDNKIGITTDYLKACYWLHVAAYNGDNKSAKILDNIRPMIEKERKKIGDQRYRQLLSDAMLKADETQYELLLIMQKLRHISEFQQPRSVVSMLPLGRPSNEMLSEMKTAGFAPSETREYLLAKYYKIVYDKYEQVVMELLQKDDDPFASNNIQYFQTMMSHLRRRAEKMRHCLITQVSEYEIR